MTKPHRAPGCLPNQCERLDDEGIAQPLPNERLSQFPRQLSELPIVPILQRTPVSLDPTNESVHARQPPAETTSEQGRRLGA